MHRRDFLLKTCAASTAIVTMSCGHLPGPRPLDLPERDVTAVGLLGSEAHLALVDWLENAGWLEYLSRHCHTEFTRDSMLDPEFLMRERSCARCGGFDDFAGTRLIHPGRPEMSILYHALASPNVTPKDVEFPGLTQLDSLENLVYSLTPPQWWQAVSARLHLAMFALEYRPAEHTPHGRHADLVFSRTGIGRIGQVPPHYSPAQRAHLAGDGDEFSVVPPRYALFLAEEVRSNRGVSLVAIEGEDEKRSFLVPIRKIFDGDELYRGSKLVFGARHLAERLRALKETANLEFAPIGWRSCEPPFRFETKSTTMSPSRDPEALAQVRGLGGSVLVCSTPMPLVRRACQEVEGREERLRFRVGPRTGGRIRTNRHYNTLKIDARPFRNAGDYILSDGLFGGGRQTTGLRSPRNAPTFVNIREEVAEDGSFLKHLSGCPEDLKRTEDGGYWAGLFVDGICDGLVSAELRGAPGEGGTGLPCPDSVKPAYSIITAPDFFPGVDPADLYRWDEAFLVGGTESLSGGRLGANAALWRNGEGAAASGCEDGSRSDDTVSAVLTRSRGAQQIRSGRRVGHRVNTLADAGGNVFAPGWETTYARSSEAAPVHLSTVGLGSPFPEDMKLCAAANGMWPGSSPDAARTFYPMLEKVDVRSRFSATSVPLLDRELGYHAESPAVERHGQPPTLGWDGECGPFLVRDATRLSALSVDFADILESDYVVNALNGRVRGSALRKLSPRTLTNRMDALASAIAALPSPGGLLRRPPRLTEQWLVSAERVSDWSAGARGLGLPFCANTGEHDALTTSKAKWSGGGYLFVFATIDGDRRSTRSSKPGRRRIACQTVHVCQVQGSHVRVARLDGLASHWDQG